MKRDNEEAHENSERWLLSYADFITLLMIFFIIMYTMSKVDAAKYQAVAKSLNVAMGGGGKSIIGTSDNPAISEKSSHIGLTEEEMLSQTKGDLDKYLEENGLSSSVESEITERGLVVRLKNSILFDSGKAEIKDDAMKDIIKIGEILSKSDNYIRVEGHTDNIPIHNQQYKSNWDLSAARATNVVELLIEKAGIKPQTISAVGYGEYRPIADNQTENGRSKNRRVEIVIVNSKFNEVENNKK
jgi:chemotaxis protein MotB